MSSKFCEFFKTLLCSCSCSFNRKRHLLEENGLKHVSVVKEEKKMQSGILTVYGFDLLFWPLDLPSYRHIVFDLSIGGQNNMSTAREVKKSRLK